LNVVLIMGSAPDVVKAKAWDLSVFTSRVAINNAWQISQAWDYLIYPEDFPDARLPEVAPHSNQRLVVASEFVPHQNSFGGFVYAGGTMAFTAGYWALGALKPDVLAFVGCDMVYSAPAGQSSHFYGEGTPDPLRADITLQSLEAKSVRLLSFAHTQGCAVINLSENAESRLLFPRMSITDLQQETDQRSILPRQRNMLTTAAVEQALQAEQTAGFMVPSGRYWEVEDQLDEAVLKAIDAKWLAAVA
jgi:hypothetical protein